jgi:UDPglucose 6-dehydrogenase
VKIAIVGTGYVGLVTGTCLADFGHNVVCIDIDQRKIKLLNDGISPIYEPGLDALIRQNVAHERLTFSSDFASGIKGAKTIFIAVGTPEGEDGSADLGYVKAVAESIAQHITDPVLVVVKSTVPVGTCDIVEQIIRERLGARGAKVTFSVASNPEFLKEGAAIDDFRRPDRIVCGVSDSFAEATFKEIYSPFIFDDPGKLLIMDRRSSELTKYGANAMLATRISFMNEMAQLCERVGANIDNVRLGMGSDPRIGRKFLYAGPGYGGSCFPKDVSALVRSGEKYGVNLSVLKAVTGANANQKQLVADKIVRFFKNNLQGKTVAVWGLSFKPGTDDVRETPAHTIIDTLVKAGAKVRAHDPKGAECYIRDFGSHPSVSVADDAYTAAEGCDALVLVTEWSEYKRPNWEKVARIMRNKAVFDFRNQYNREDLLRLGFHYECVGRPDSIVKTN